MTQDVLCNTKPIKRLQNKYLKGSGLHIGGEAVDIAGNRATTYAIVNIDKTPPQLNISANPDTLWPPNHKMVDVAIDGEGIDNISGIAQTIFSVEDEYGEIEPVISDFNTTIQLEAWRNGNDKDGRVYTISVITKDDRHKTFYVTLSQ